MEENKEPLVHLRDEVLKKVAGGNINPSILYSVELERRFMDLYMKDKNTEEEFDEYYNISEELMRIKNGFTEEELMIHDEICYNEGIY